MTRAVPTRGPDSLATKRLILRWLTPDDVDLLLAVWNDPAFIRHVGDRGIRTRHDAAIALADGPLRLYEKYGYGPFRVALRNADTPIGICGLFRRDFLDRPDIGFALLPDFGSQGYGLEAARAVVNYARDQLQLPRLAAIVSPGNARSIALIGKLGLDFEKMIHMPDEEQDVCLYSVEWSRVD